MLSILLLFAACGSTGWLLARLFELPTRFLAGSATLILGAAQYLLSVQLLSLGGALQAVPLLGANLLATGAVALASFRRRPFQRAPLPSFATAWWSAAKASPLFLSVGALAVVGAILSAFLGIALFPATDSYHVNMCLFWKQRGTIAAFPVFDPRIVAFVFAGEALALPGFIFSRTPLLFVVESLLLTGLCTWAVHQLCRAIGASLRAAFATATVFFASTPVLYSISSVRSDVLLSTFCLLVSLAALFEIRRTPAKIGTLVGCAAFAFGMACGAKNAILLHLPAVGLIVLGVLPRGARHFRLTGIAVVCGLVAAIASGFIWSYAQNALWFGDFRGHPFIKAHLAQDFDLSSVWTRITRSVAIFLLDPGWLPGSWQPQYGQVVGRLIQLLGGKLTLAEDDGFYSLDLANFRAGSGLGFIGPLLLLPAAIVAGGRAFSRSPSEDSSSRRNELLLFGFAIVSFVVFVILLRTQRIGVLRLMFSCFAAAIPLAHLVLRARLGAWLGAGIAIGSILLSVVHPLVMWASREKIAALQPLVALKRTPPTEVEVTWDDGRVEPFELREPHSHRAFYQAVTSKVPPDATVGIIAELFSEGHFAFGPDYRRTVIPLNDCRSAEIFTPPETVTHIFIEHHEPRDLPPEVLRGFKLIFSAREQGSPRFALLAREAAPEP